MRKLHPTYCKLIATLLLLGCSIALSAQGKTYHVKVDSEITTSGNDGLSWEKAITLTNALSLAKAGDEIWVKGYEDITGHIYKAPNGGFVLPSGVGMYGGFEGKETNKNVLPTGRHKYQMKYQTALVGDIATNDKASQQLIIYPENSTRTDNATHVLTLQMGVTKDNTNDGNKPTIVSGFLIAAGNARGVNTSANGRGGGIYVVNNSNDNNAGSRYFRISQCNFANNYGMRGGAIYVDNSCTNPQSAISYCSFFDNVAGKRGTSENEGGGMWIDGTVTVYNCNINNNTNGGIRLSNTSKIVNCSVIANTVSAVDLTTAGASGSNGGGAVYNTVLWHSTALSKQDTRPAFYFCAFPEVKVTNSDTNTDDNGNVWISNENHGTEPAPWFKQSAVNQGYDFSFSSNLKQLYSTAFTFEETSALLNKGKLEYYTNLVVNANLETTSTDIMGRTRYQTSTIDIGAYEYARMKAGRIRYVKPEKEGKGDGSTWNDATDDIQWAINDLAEKAPGEKGEVWVAAGTYVVKDRILADDSSAPVSLLMKNGISVYGAFEGNEKSRSERIEKAKNLKPWGWKKESIIRGAEFTGSGDANWNNTDEAWNIKTSGSYHVVWFAPLPGGNAFTDEVYLEGFTIEGGKYNETNAAQYDPDCGAGVYINDPSARMRYCTVRFCNPGMKKTTNTQPRGGGIYCKNGQTEGNLVYNCSAYQGGGIYIDEAGFITRSMVTNCSAYQGAGVYLKGDADNSEKAYYQILATSVISNNTSTRNGAVYLDGHGLVINNTIANNYTNNTPDAADEMSSYTGGVYIKEKGLLANNVIWNNSLLRHKSGTSNSASMAQIYAAKPSEKTVQFYNNAISDVNAAKWTNTYQSGTISINTYYSGKGFVMGTKAPYNTVEAFNEKRGVLTDMKTVNYYWETLKGTRLRNVGISYALLPSSYLYQPKIDLSGKAISSVPSAGAYMTDNQDLVFEKNDTQKRLRIYFDRSRELVDGTGESWEKSYTSSSVDEILGYLADIKDKDNIKVVTKGNTTPEDFTIKKNSGWEFEICGREGIFEPKIAYTFEETDARSCTFNIQPCVLPVTVYGGYPEYSENPNPKDEDRDPIKYRTELNGNLSGSELNEGLYHLVRIEAGANITIDGYAFTHAYAAGTAYMPYGGGVLIGSMDQSSEPTTVKLKNCIFENNTAADGAAIATMPDAVNVKLELENCVINNNTSKDPHNQNPSELPSIIYLNKSQGSNNSLTLNHVSIINNEGVAPDNDLVKKTSYAVGNKLYINGAWDGSKCNNSLEENINTLGKDGALNFSNPTNEVGARMSGNVYYGGYSSFRPLTSSAEAGRIINSAQASNATAKDITGEDRNLGGAPDLGAYEALLPKAGKIIYVRSYNKNYDSISDANDDDKDGNPDFNLLNESNTEYDGSSWDKAIIGNAMCDNKQARSGNDFYVTQSDNTLLSTTIDNKDYSQAKGKYRSEIDSYGKFWESSGNQNKQLLSGWGTYNKIANNREERYISGLQYAVERAAELNKDITDKKDRVVVWVGAGIYTDYKGFVVRDKVEVIGGFPYEGYPGEDDRHPLLSQYVPARKEYETLDKTKYETILQIRKESPVYFKNGDKEMWYQENNSGDGSKYDFTKTLMNSGNTERHYVLYQPDVCLPTWSPSGDGNSSRTDGNAVRYKGNLIDNINYKDYEYAKWDGFSVRHGYIINYPDANRDGGAGVRVFRGVELENLIIVNNFNHGGRVRGGGLYMDGENSKISNSYLLRNLSYANSSESYGGGAYMIQGTGYNLVVANNRCYNGTCRGGGIFLESAKFYNNTIAYNMATNGTGIYHWQDSNTGVSSQLSLYNCIIYDNYNNGKSITDQVNSAASGKMNPSHNCYMNSNDLSSKFQESDGNFTGDKAQAFPFEDQSYESGNNFRFRNARLKNNFRLYEAGGLTGNKCLNGGTTNVGNGIILPETDMDYTNRIKDCAIDIGAYEADNTANIAPQEKTNSGSIVDYIYYVTQNGWGNRSGDSPENAACADKLQDVLTAAGKKFETANQGITDNSQKHQVYVKVAGYQADETGKRFTYHANTLADPSDPQSYTFLIPNGVCLMGGYYEGDQEGGELKEGTANWNNDKRDCISTYQTVLSAKTEVKEGSAVNQEVNGYHTVCFGKWPTGDYDGYNTTALTDNTIIDGCRLIDGNANDKSGFKSMGGAAIVPRMAHVRNCEISDCQATQGGALMLLKGSIVSGSVIVRNKAQKGGAIYALRSNDKNEDIKNYHAYVISCTIARNEATIGGGIYQEENSLIGGNSVIWGNTAQTDNNISGDVNYKAFDYLQAQGQGAYTEEFYPYNYCFVEKMALPANRMNTEMTSDLDSYFNDNKIFKPRAYSPLIGNGVEKAYVNAWKKYGISNYDITGKERTMTKQQTAGAYASDLPAFNKEKLLKRLFVSQTGGEIVTEEEKAKYYGRSFLTPFNSLEAALDYINEARTEGVATEATHFEILMTGGTYKPSKMRQNQDLSPEQNTIDRRLQSFTIPVNVDIFGSFSEDDLYSSTPVNPTTGEKTGDEFTSFGDKTLVPDGDIKVILAERNNSYMTDNNKNGLIEPWEFSNPTILSGDIKASEKERNVYHVVYSNAGTTGSSATANNEVVLDGITIMNGETMTQLKIEEEGTTEVAEIGRGGAIYTNRVNYTLNRCRLIKNSGLHGGAVYVNNASLDIIGSTISGNSNVSEKASKDEVTEPGKGGAIYLYLTESKNGNLHIVNSLLANNDVTYGKYTGTKSSQGGAIYIRRANDASTMTADYQDAYIVNSLIVNNKAMQDGAIHVENEVTNGTITPILYNTAIWGNESTVTEGDKVLLKREHMRNCAWDELPAPTATDGNIKLNKENIASDGPRFTAPTTTKGYEGYTQDAKWNPQAISVLTDAGDGRKDANVANEANEEGKYFDWWNKHENRLKDYGYRSEYIRSANSSKEYFRYVGPKDENGNVAEKPIDIGMYEFQYVFTFTDFEKVYIGTEEKGNGDGSSWDNQSTDLRGAIIAMANPSGSTTPGSTTNSKRKVYVRGGTYYSPTYSGGDAFSLIVNKADKAEFIESIELVGGCTGSKNTDGTEVQDFSKPSVLIENPAKAGKTTNLLNIETNGKPVTISGFTFQNQSGVGVKAMVNEVQAGTGKGMKLHHCAFSKNNGTGMVVNNQKECGINMWNVLFADGNGNGLTMYGSQKVDITNATFVCNKDTAVSGTQSVYNSVAWKNGTQNLKPTNRNIVIEKTIENGDVLNGPNFVDPEHGDYRIRPSFKLLDQGSNNKYKQNVGLKNIYKDKSKKVLDYAKMFAKEKDLGNTARLIGDSIDIGAYECDTKMIQIIFVKEGSAVAGTGENWDSPTNDLQGAINLAELYANKHTGEYGYVFVDRNLKAKNVNISMPGVKMFGSMRNETSSATGTENIVSDLLSQRKGIIESSTQSAINGLTLNNATTGTENRMCLVDGFKVSGNVSLQGNSMLSTSLLDANAKVSGDASGLLYNSLALGTVENVKPVNVTASGELPSPDGSAANRASVNTYNKYVKDDYWKYQLDETDKANINQHDANVAENPTKACINKVMHNHDLAGNQRIRDKVDNGCFETWYLTNDAEANKVDYPHGKSVVYVMAVDKELKLDNGFYTETNPFSPGFLLLKHHAGLRGNNSYVNLTNFAVERNLKAGTNFFSMPFKATNMEVEGTNNPADGSVIAYYYNAATRAKYDYKFEPSKESKAWVKGVDNQRNFTAGLRMEAKADKTVRFYGNSYSENGSQLGQITLVQNNNQQPWSSSDGSGTKFTHKENMGWNLFGSPYLCAMNYSDMEYGRVIYQCEENGSYKAINTYDSNTGNSTDGYIPAMDAVFTQTATLENSESVIVSHSEAKATTAYQATRALDIAITQSSRTSRAGNGTPVDDQLQLNAVPAQEAKSDFDMGSDGVKWMASQNAQIYVSRNGGRYSLLSAVSIEAEQSIGVSLPETGEYSISIPEDCDASEYETVWLKDKETGKAVDLKDGSYQFYAAQAGEMNNRFNISFNRKETDMKSDITIIPNGNYHILIKGLKQNDLIRIYGTSGVLALQKQAKSDTEQLRSPVNGTVAVEVTRGGKQIAVKKIALK